MLLAGCHKPVNKDVTNNNSTANKNSPTELEGDNEIDNHPNELEVDYSDYFDEKDGTAVFYSRNENTYSIYNKKLAELPSSPCSSFKIISCLMGLESGIIDPADSILPWNETIYPVEAWNKDIGYQEAFQSSCIWYYRQVIDQLGKEHVQNILDQLNYGNRDISEWDGSLNNMIFPDMKDFEELNGFWQESSLQITPKGQVDVLRSIFEDNKLFSQKNLNLIKEIMYVENSNEELRIYGKTGSGIKDDIWEDAWFVGMYETNEDTIYFAVRLNRPGARGQDARDVTIQIINDRLGK
jgi:bla regulator protein BlaR1